MLPVHPGNTAHQVSKIPLPAVNSLKTTSARAQEECRASEQRDISRYYAQVSVSKLPSSKRDEGSSEQRPILGLGQEMCKSVLEHSTVPKSQDMLKKNILKRKPYDNGGTSKGHRSQLKRLQSIKATK